MMFESREEELARKLAANEREVTQRVRQEDTDRAIVQLIKGMDVITKRSPKYSKSP